MKSIDKGHLVPFWDSSFKNLDFEKQPLLDSEIEQWKQDGFDQKYCKSFSGSMYSNKNPLPNWVKQFEGKFGLKNQTYNFYKLDTFEIMPPHSDHYNTYVRLYEADRSKVFRVLVMLEDWKPGHYLEINGKGYVNWRAGDYYVWNNDTPHAAANIGNQPRYTLQITGEEDESHVLDQSNLNIELFGFNTDFTNTFRNKDQEKFINELFKRTNVKNEVTWIFFGCGPIPDLALHIHKVRPSRVHIFLYEPFSHSVEGKYTAGYYSEYPYSTQPSLIKVDELDSIVRYAKNNKLKPEQVIVHTGHYKVQDFYGHYDDVTLLTDDLFVKSYPLFYNTYFNPNQFFRYTFLCQTWRYTKHRHIVTAYLSHLNTKYNWFYHCDKETLKDNIYFDWEEWKNLDLLKFHHVKEGIERLNNQAPVCLDIDVDDVTYVTKENNSFYPKSTTYKNKQTPAQDCTPLRSFEDIFSDVFCVVVCETRFAEHTANFSEKVYQAMQMKRPFIVVGPPLVLEYIRSLGFKTFADFWDESYDLETDHSLRLLKLFDLFNKINSLTNEEQQKMYADMFQTLYHNFRLVSSKIL